MEAAVRESLATAPGAVLIIAGGEPVAETVRRVRDAKSTKIIVLLIDSRTSTIDRAMLISAVGPLAIELAPDTRIGAVEATPGATPEDVAEVAHFLTTARSTTGQILTVRGESLSAP